MTLETETVLDRRRLRRGSRFWRALAHRRWSRCCSAARCSLGDELLGLVRRPQQIARVTIEGTITDDRDQLAHAEEGRRKPSTCRRARVRQQPGRHDDGRRERCSRRCASVAEKKPVVAQFGTVAASAGYIVGLGTDHIVARGNTITGSVGVIVQWPEVDAAARQARRQDERDQERRR